MSMSQCLQRVRGACLRCLRISSTGPEARGSVARGAVASTWHWHWQGGLAQSQKRCKAGFTAGYKADLTSFPHRRWGKEEYVQAILSAQVYDAANDTPLQLASVMSTRLDNTVYFKREDLQPVFSFKIRGAYNHIANLTDEEKKRGVGGCSAGNHAQGVALSCKMLGMSSTIVMPEATPRIKVDAVIKHGGKVILHGATFDEAKALAKSLEEEQGMLNVPPFNDPYVIAGQGTIAMELVRERNGKPLDAVFVCCGGGGMLAGIAVYLKTIRPEVRIIGVEAADAAGMTASLDAGKVVNLDSVGLFADGAAVREVGDETFRLCHQYVDQMITVSTDEICAAMKHAFEDTRTLLEPAGALAIAGVEKYARETQATGEVYIATTSGANIDFDRMRYVSERADATEVLVSVTIPEKPGAFQALYNRIYPRNVTEFSYRYHTGKQAKIYLGFQPTSGVEDDVAQVVASLEDDGFGILDLSDNEMAKAHGRYLCGGRSGEDEGGLVEKIYRFEFPERPGALKLFLDNMQWNVTLFHYRNHGSDVGRVLVGVQIPEEHEPEWSEGLLELGFTHTVETDNAIYEQFLRK